LKQNFSQQNNNHKKEINLKFDHKMGRTELTLNKEFHISHLKENSSNIWQAGATIANNQNIKRSIMQGHELIH
jgi:hypothetical protein